MRPSCLLSLIVVVLCPAVLPAATLTVVVYAMDARAADRFPPGIADDRAKLVAHLQALRKSGEVVVPLEFSSDLPWSTKVETAEGEDVEISKSFTAEGQTLKREQTAVRKLGYNATVRALRGGDGRGRIDMTFEWTPTMAKLPIPDGGEAAWMPKFHTFKAQINHTAPPEEPFVAAMWRSGAPLAERDRGSLRQLFLIVHWSEDTAEK